MSTVAQTLFTDPRIERARALLLEAVQEHRAGLTGIRAADPALTADYEETIKSFGAARGGALYFPYLGSGIGNGALVELADGSVKLDLISGIGVHYFGHTNAALVSAGIDAALRDTVMQGNLQQGVESAALAKAFLEIANPPERQSRLAHCFLSSSGAMANENALKMLFQKLHPAGRVLAFSHGFAGRTMALAQITDKAGYRAGLPTTLTVDYVPFYNPDQPDMSTRHAVAVIKEHLKRYPKQHAFMWMELVQGEGGFYTATRDFFLPVLNLLRESGIAIWFDEIQTFARTTRPFAFQHFGLEEFCDVVTVGKITQVCATLFSDAFVPRPGLVSQTFTASTSAIFAGQVILEEMKRGGLFGENGRIMQVRRRFMGHLERIGAAHPEWIKGPFGEGAMIAFTPFDGSEATVKKLLAALFDAGVVAFLCGADPYRIRFLPPVGAITDDQIDQVCTILEQVLEKHAS